MHRSIINELKNNQSKATRQKEKTTWQELIGLLFVIAAFCIVP